MVLSEDDVYGNKNDGKVAFRREFGCVDIVKTQRA